MCICADIMPIYTEQHSHTHTHLHTYQTVQNIGGSNTLEIIDFITKGEEETGNLYNQAATGNRSECDDREENENALSFNLPDCPAGVDVGRDSMCVLPRDSLLPPPTCENTKATVQEGVGESVLAASALATMRERDSVRGSMIGGAYLEDCQEEGEARLAVAASLKQERQEKQLQQGKVKHGGTPAELERCVGDEEVQRRIGEAALRISRMVELVCMPTDAAAAPTAEPLAAATLLSAEESATFDNIGNGSLEDETEDVLSVAVGRLKEALEKQGHAYKAYEQAQHLQQLQQQQVRPEAGTHDCCVSCSHTACCFQPAIALREAEREGERQRGSISKHTAGCVSQSSHSRTLPAAPGRN